MGLSSTGFQDLAGKIDAIYHSGALVDFIQPYSRLKSANVLGTQEVLRLACTIRPKPVHHVSTIGVFDSLHNQGGGTVKEDTPLKDDQGLYYGYAQSKWVAEQLVKTAGSRGLPVCIYRPGAISGDSQTGAWETNGIASRTIKGCIQLGLVPNLDAKIEMVPVDYVSRALVQLSRKTSNYGKVFHLVNSHPLPLREMIELIRSFGFKLKAIPYEQWLKRLSKLPVEAPDNFLAPLLPMILEKVPGSQFTAPEMYTRMPAFDTSNTREGLTGSAIACPPVDQKLLKGYISGFLESHFLEKS